MSTPPPLPEKELETWERWWNSIGERSKIKMHRKLTVLAVSIAAALGIIGVGLTGPAAAADHCGWKPANNANAQGSIVFWVIPEMYNGPDFDCPAPAGRAWSIEYSTLPPSGGPLR